MAAARFEGIRPEPASFWIRWAPRRWSGSPEPFVDLARGRLASDALRAGGPALPPAAEAEVVYFPPLAPDSRAGLAGWLDRAEAAGFGALIQILAGEKVPPGSHTLVVDLTAALLEQRLESLDELPPGAAAVWPLLSGLTDDEELLEAGCARLAAAGVRSVQAVVPDLTPSERRRLSDEGGEKVYQALFHGAAPSAVTLARKVVAHGMSPWTRRPLLEETGRRGRNQTLAAHLATLADGYLLVGRPEGAAQSLFRAARWVEGETRDVAAVAREGNLGVVDWLEPGARGEIERFTRDGGREAIAELTAALGAPD